VLSQSAAATRMCRILYFGPGGAGKRENLRQIGASIPPDHRLSLATDDPARQIAFRLTGDAQGDWTVVVHAVDIGREIYIENGADQEGPFDGIVFVAHSSGSRLDQNLTALEALKAFLDRWGQDVMSIPMVFQYNQREDGDCQSVDQLESLLNPWGLLSFPASTQHGEGVKETLKALLSLTISRLLQPRGATRPEARGGAGKGGSGPRGERTQMRHPGQNSGPGSGAGSSGQPSLEVEAEERRGLFFDDRRPPIVVPVRIPRKLLEKYGSARIVLEIEVDDSKGVLD
jgi:signal recognition particle receptor subunit beta